MAKPKKKLICFDDIRLMLKDETISDKQINNLIKEIRKREKIRKAEGTLQSTEEILKDITGKMVEDSKIAAIIEKRNKAKNLTIDKQLDTSETRHRDPADAAQSKTVGTYMSRGSVDQLYKSYQADYLVGLVHDLRDAETGLLEIARKGVIDEDIAMERGELMKEDGKPGITQNREALAIAEIIHKWQEKLRRDLNNRGAWITELEDFIASTSHDPDKLKPSLMERYKAKRGGYDPWDAKYQQWKSDIFASRLNQSKVFEDVASEDIEAFMRGSFDALVSGLHKNAGKGADSTSKISGFKGPANLARKLSEARKFHWEDGKGWWEYHKKYGRGTLLDTVMSGLDSGARNVALMQVFGTNPEDGYIRWIERMMEKYRTSAEPGAMDKFNSLKSQSKKLQNFWKEVSGETQMAHNAGWAKFSSGLRLSQNLAKLGGLLLSQPNDIATIAVELSRNGIHPLEGYYTAMTNLFKGRTAGEIRLLADLIGVGADGIVGDLAGRISALDNVPSAMRKIQRAFFKATGGEWWTDSHKTGVGLILSHNLGRNKMKAFAELDPDLQTTLRIYDIDSGKWDIIRRYSTEVEGKEFISPDLMQNITDDEVRAYMISQGIDKSKIRGIQDFKRRLEVDLRSYFVDRTDHAVLTPGARELAAIRLGTRPGTLEGEALRFFGQFKAFPYTMIHKMLGGEIYRGGARNLREAFLSSKYRGDLLGLSHLLVATTVLGYISMSMKDLAKGKMPRDPTDWKTFIAAFTQGNGAGIYGDFAFGEFNRFGRSALSSLAGPTIGQLDDVLELWTRWKKGEDLGAQGFRMALNNAPFINLFYTRWALNYLFLYNIQEHMNPGYLRRMERRVERENAQTYIFPPSKYSAGR
ncbi:hypothetical protein [Candidatus Magnetobacterium casense]|uniref:Uncharacterized protein n=1 Tax=Candidatus Magnetobacterium casense TaxID=1455061 RepID=A0ABS6RYR4_9BACT|nr:hypothetical protein [Candidatus Magnetobacterium casensis]MBV6341751.1 hypothetical protein [Candidatus Magnetobacterium casensis]